MNHMETLHGLNGPDIIAIFGIAIIATLSIGKIIGIIIGRMKP